MASILPNSPFHIFMTVFILFSFIAIQISGEEDQYSFVKAINPKSHKLRKEKLSHFRFYWHDILSGKYPTSVTVVRPLNITATAFGMINMIDNPLTMGPDLGSKRVGKAQGFYASASQEEVGFLMTMNFAFSEGKYNGSSITILGRNPVLNTVREMPVVGGSGLFFWLRQSDWYSLLLQSCVVLLLLGASARNKVLIMEVSSDSVSIDIDNMIPFGGKEVRVKTSKGSISVFVSGNREKPALITYPDVALNYMSCFRGLFFCQDAASLLLHNFCIYHVDAPGHELGADVISSDMPLLSVDDLADQVAEVLDFFRLQKVFCLGVTAGAYILTLFSMKYEERVAALILVSPICRAPSWTEWIYNKILLNLLYFYGMRGLLKECLLQRYFSKELRLGTHDAESDIVLYCQKLLGQMQSPNVMRFLHAINERHDLTEGLRNLQCKTLIFVGENSPFHADSMHMSNVRDKKVCALVEVQSCGSLVTEELPHAMLVPIEFFLMGFGFNRQTLVTSLASSGSLSPNPSRHWCIAPELLSSESLGIKLKPIKTRPGIKI